MIDKEEIKAKALEFDINESNVQRDYIFGWVLCGIYTISQLKDILILKGGNGFRKAYFTSTRYSNDLDFSTQSELDQDMVLNEFEKICDYVQSKTGVIFDKEKNNIKEKPTVDREAKYYEGKIYFRDFFGNKGNITISIKLDIKEFDKIYLPLEKRNLIHPYSDSDQCYAVITCLKLEEMLAAKLKCLLQRICTHDLYDFVYAIFINKELDVNRSEIVSVFLKKTIFGRSPGVVRGLLLGLPFQTFKAVWSKYITCPKQSIISFNDALSNFSKCIEELFNQYINPGYEKIFYPAEMRNLILEAGSKKQLMSVTYDGYIREVEPYSLAYKQRKDGHAEEYFYVWDRSGGKSDPGVKTFINTRITDIKLLDEKFEPRFPIELSKAGEQSNSGYFTKQSFSNKPARSIPGAAYGIQSRRSSANRIYTLQCSYCLKRFRRSKPTTKLNRHKDNYGNNCFGRVGYRV